MTTRHSESWFVFRAASPIQHYHKKAGLVHCFARHCVALSNYGQIVNCQLLKSSKDWKTSDQFWDNRIFEYLLQRFLACRLDSSMALLFLTRKQVTFSQDVVISSIRQSSTTMKIILSIHLDHLLLRVFTSPLRWNTSDPVPSMIFKRACCPSPGIDIDVPRSARSMLKSAA